MNYAYVLLMVYGFACGICISGTMLVVCFLPPYSRLPAAYTALGVHTICFHLLLKELRTFPVADILTDVSGILLEDNLQNDLLILEFCLLFYTSIFLFKPELVQDDNRTRWISVLCLTARIWVMGENTALFWYFLFLD